MRQWDFGVRGEVVGLSASGGGGVLESTIGWTPGFGKTALVITLAYQWLPYMVLPIYAGLDRLPASLLDDARMDSLPILRRHAVPAAESARA